MTGSTKSAILIISNGDSRKTFTLTKDITMDYYDSAENLIISRDRALQELRAHSCEDFHEFFQDLGDKSEYLAQDVLNWLGY